MSVPISSKGWMVLLSLIRARFRVNCDQSIIRQHPLGDDTRARADGTPPVSRTWVRLGGVMDEHGVAVIDDIVGACRCNNPRNQIEHLHRSIKEMKHATKCHTFGAIRAVDFAQQQM
jgi:hypothetical protein